MLEFMFMILVVILICCCLYLNLPLFFQFFSVAYLLFADFQNSPLFIESIFPFCFVLSVSFSPSLISTDNFLSHSSSSQSYPIYPLNCIVCFFCLVVYLPHCWLLSLILAGFVIVLLFSLSYSASVVPIEDLPRATTFLLPIYLRTDCIL